jgi:hypothetical protein
VVSGVSIGSLSGFAVYLFITLRTHIMSMKKTVLASIFLACSALAQAQDTPSSAPDAKPAAATDDRRPGSGPNPFTDCGIGAALFPTVHWAAVTSNVIWDIGTTALTSATASPQTCSGKRVAAAIFINDTYEKLAEETARGQGEHLNAVLNILGCDGARHAVAIEAARGAMGEAVATPGYATQRRLDKAADFYGIVESAVSSRCAA